MVCLDALGLIEVSVDGCGGRYVDVEYVPLELLERLLVLLA